MTLLPKLVLEALNDEPNEWRLPIRVAEACGCREGEAINALRMMCVHKFAQRIKGDEYRITPAGQAALKEGAKL